MVGQRSELGGVMLVWCWLFGHRFYYKFGGLLYDSTTYRYTDFCTRCGKRVKKEDESWW